MLRGNRNLVQTIALRNWVLLAFDDDYSDPGKITTIEGSGFYPQAGINFLLGLNVKF